MYERFPLLSNQGHHRHPTARLVVSEEYDEAISAAKIKQNSTVDGRPSSYAVRSFMDQTNRSFDQMSDALESLFLASPSISPQVNLSSTNQGNILRKPCLRLELRLPSTGTYQWETEGLLVGYGSRSLSHSRKLGRRIPVVPKHHKIARNQWNEDGKLMASFSSPWS